MSIPIFFSIRMHDCRYYDPQCMRRTSGRCRDWCQCRHQSAFLFFSYFMDGFAFTGEAMLGRFEGAGDNRSAALAIRQLLKWTALMMLIFVTLYASGLRFIVQFLSDSQLVAQSVESCLLWVLCIPIAGAFAFIFDGFMWDLPIRVLCCCLLLQAWLFSSQSLCLPILRNGCFGLRLRVISLPVRWC